MVVVAVARDEGVALIAVGGGLAVCGRVQQPDGRHAVTGSVEGKPVPAGVHQTRWPPLLVVLERDAVAVAIRDGGERQHCDAVPGRDRGEMPDVTGDRIGDTDLTVRAGVAL